MAITITSIVTSSSATDATTYSLPSTTPSSNTLILYAAASRRSGGTPSTPTLTGCGLTWTLINTAITPGFARKVVGFYAMGTPNSTALVITYAETQSQWVAALSECAGVDTSGVGSALIQSATTSGTGPTALVSLGAFANTANVAFGIMMHILTDNAVVGSGFTELQDFPLDDGGSQTRLQTEYKLNDPSVDASWANSEYACIAFEVGIDTAGGAPTLFISHKMQMGIG